MSMCFALKFESFIWILLLRFPLGFDSFVVVLCYFFVLLTFENEREMERERKRVGEKKAKRKETIVCLRVQSIKWNIHNAENIKAQRSDC